MRFNDTLQSIEENQQKIASYGKFDDAILKKINYKLRLDWNYYSNRMEGGTLTKAETRSVMVGNIDVKGKPFKDVAEMTGHDKIVLEVLKMSKGELRIAEKRIKEIHKAIMYEEDAKKATQIGKWKSEPNEIINYKGEKISFTQPNEVAEELHKLIDRANAELDKFYAGKKSKHPIEIAAQFHIDFVSVHPFYDGNGRTTRVLTNILLMACSYPAIIIKDEHKQAYYKLLGDIQVYGGKADLFYAFIAERVLETQQLILDALEGKEIEEPDDIDKRVAMLDRMMEGMEEGIQKTKNEEVMHQMLKEIVEPLFRKVFEKVLKISPLFASTEFTFFIDGSGSSHHNINELIENIEISWEQKKNNVRNINLQIQLSKLKKLGTKAFDMHAHIKINFEKHKYQVELQQDEIIDRLYHQILSFEKVEEIASKFANTIINQIEEKLKNHTKQ